MADNDLRIKISLDADTSAASKVEKSVLNIGTAADKTSAALDMAKNALAAIGVALGVRELVQYADTWNLLEGRLRLVTTSTQNLAAVQKELFDVAQRSRVGYEATAELYTRMARSTETLGVSQTQLLGVTETISKTLAISGTSAESASAALMQLGQGFASGTLRGEELNSVLEQAPRLAEAIAKGMGKTVGELRQLGADGKLTAEEVFKALQKQREAVDKEFGMMPQTIGQSMTQIENSFISLVGTADDAINGSGGVTEILSYFSKAMDDNQAEIIEFGRDFLRVLQMMGTWVMQAGAGSYRFLLGIPTAFLTAIDALTTHTSNFINKAIEMAEKGYNYIQSLYGGKAIKLGRVDFGTNLSSGWQAHYNDMTSFLDIASKTQGKLFDEIAADTTVLKNNNGGVSSSRTGGSGSGKTGPTKAEIAAAKKAAREAAKEAEEAFKKELKFIDDREKATLSYYESIGDDSTAFYIKEADKMQELAKAGILSNAQMLEVWLKDTAEFEQKKQQLIFQAEEEAKAALKTYNDGLITAQIDYYTAIGDESSAYYLQEEEKMKKLAETGWYTNEQMNAIKAKDNQKFRDEQWKRDNAFWVDLFENINKAMDDQFFNAMTGKFTKFGDWLKDLWGSITQSMSRGLSKSLADMMTGAFYKENKDGSLSGLIPPLSTNTFRMAGSGTALGYGSVLSADQVAQLGGTFGQATVTAGGTIIDQGGRVIEAGSDLTSAINSASAANSLYAAITGGISSSVANGFASLSASTYNLTGSSALAGGIGNFGAGMAAPWSTGAGAGTAAQAGAMVGGAALGAAGGYALGSIGDKVFGADTKAANYGAIGGAIGSLAGPIGAIAGAVIGSLIGGAFGSTKTKDAGLNFGKTTGAGLGFDSIQSYADMQKKSWFSNKKWTDFADISENDRKKIKGIFDSYDYLLAQLGSVKHVALSAGKYTKDTFQDELAKSFITSYTGMKEKFKASFGGFLLLPEVENKAFTQIYNAWTEYAQSINKTTLEAITESVGQFVQSKRGFETWSLERSGNQIASLGKQAEWAQQDFDNLAKTIGVSGITIDNFLSKYEDAVKNSFDPNTIKQWDSLGSSLMNATNASDKYNQALADMASASGEASNTIANAASQLQAASAALNINLKSQQLTASIAQMLAPDQKASALIGAESSRSQYDTLQKFYGTSLSDSEFLSTMQNSLSANQTEANVAMWNELSTAFAGAYQAEKQYQSIIESERIAQLQAEQQAAEALANQQRQAAEEAARAAEERQRQLEEERKALEALKITSRDFLRGFNETILKDDPINLASYQLQYLTSDLNTFEQQLGISGVSLSNFATAYENAIAKNFTEENVNSWKSFGETLIKANDAQKAYNDSLKQTVNTGFMKDMMLSRVNQSGTALDIKEMVNQQAANNTNQSQQIAILYEVVKTLKDQLKIMKFGTTNQGVPA